jgi:asparagine synthase (glutamine-hydrolysing)
MCGITGVASENRIGEAERVALGPMLARLVHRGPDDAGQYADEHVALGHRRLSIIDLTTGRQPLSNEAGTIWAVVNGEIYNFLQLREELRAKGHVFRSASDSECLVHLYEDCGDRCVERLSGMFAIALWDRPRRRLLLGRDRLGVKPLYYRHDGRRLIFASELKAILAAPDVPVEVDPTALADFLTFSFIPSPKTILKGVNKLPPAHTLTYQDGRVSVRRYWDLQFQGHRETSVDLLAEELWERLCTATRSRLIADVPLGAFLSGGLDSTSVVAAMTEAADDPVEAVTCGFSERGFDERKPARRTAEALHCRHHESLVLPHAADMAETLSWHFDEPFADASAIPTYYLSRETRRHVTVALSGDGGDEALAGYRRYRFDVYEDRLRGALPGAVRRMLGPIAGHYPTRPWIPRPLRAAATLRDLAVDAPTAHGLSVATLGPAEVRRLLAPDVAAEVGDYDPLERVRELYRRCDAPDHLSKCQYVDIFHGLAEGILVKVDRASMAHALEVRSPMLDHRFIEFAWSIPPRYRIRGRQGKHPLRVALGRRLGEAFAGRRKAGFEVPLDEWFADPLRDRFQDTLLRPGAAVHYWASSEEIGRVWREHLAGRRRCGPTLWKLVMLDGWCRRFMRTAVKPTDRIPAGLPGPSGGRLHEDVCNTSRA